MYKRQSNDYVPKMIDIAGGEYVFQNLKGEDNAASSVNMQDVYKRQQCERDGCLLCLIFIYRLVCTNFIN